MNHIISNSGQRVKLEDWQTINKLPKNKVDTYFTVSEFDCDGELLIAAPLLALLTAFRTALAKPVIINSGFRSESKQEALRLAGYKAATNSPHCVGMAADIDTNGAKQTQEYIAILKTLAKDKGIKARFGHKQYAAIGQSFIHVDVCPMYYGKGAPYHSQPHPAVWENEIEW